MEKVAVAEILKLRARSCRAAIARLEREDARAVRMVMAARAAEADRDDYQRKTARALAEERARLEELEGLAAQLGLSMLDMGVKPLYRQPDGEVGPRDPLAAGRTVDERCIPSCDPGERVCSQCGSIVCVCGMDAGDLERLMREEGR